MTQHRPQHRVAVVTATFAAIGPHSGVEFIVRICRNLEQPRSFYPVVFRTTLCRFKLSAVSGVADEEVDVLDPLAAREGFASERQALDSAMAALKSRRKLHWAKLVNSVEFRPR